MLGQLPLRGLLAALGPADWRALFDAGLLAAAPVRIFCIPLNLISLPVLALLSPPFVRLG